MDDRTNTSTQRCGVGKWDESNPFNAAPHRCGLIVGHTGPHRCGEDNGTAGGCSFTWDETQTAAGPTPILGVGSRSLGDGAPLPTPEQVKNLSELLALIARHTESPLTRADRVLVAEHAAALPSIIEGARKNEPNADERPCIDCGKEILWSVSDTRWTCQRCAELTTLRARLAAAYRASRAQPCCKYMGTPNCDHPATASTELIARASREQEAGRE